MMTVGVKTIWRKQSGVGGNGQQQQYQEGLKDDSAGKCYGKNKTVPFSEWLQQA